MSCVACPKSDGFPLYLFGCSNGTFCMAQALYIYLYKPIAFHTQVYFMSNGQIVEDSETKKIVKFREIAIALEKYQNYLPQI